MADTDHIATAEPSLRALSERLAALEFANLHNDVREHARQRLFDTLGALVVGMATSEGERLRRYADVASGDGRSFDLGQRCRLYVGATRSTEVDDIDIESCTTVGSVIVPVALTMASTPSRHGGTALLTALVAGYEAMIRLGRAIGGATLIYRGVWPTYVTAAFGAAATAAKLLNLDAALTEQALALSLARAAPAPAGALRGDFRYYALGCAATEGADAACAAAAGIAGDSAALAEFAKRWGVALDSDAWAVQPDTPWLIAAVDTKLWPTSRQALAGVAAYLSLGVQAEEAETIDTIRVYVPAAYRAMVDRQAPPTQRIESMIGVQYQLALATVAPSALYDALRPTLKSGPPVQRLMSKIEVLEDETLTRRFPRQWGGRVGVRYRGGGERTAEVVDPEGSAAHPLGWQGLKDKYARIFRESGINHAAWLKVTRRRCEQIGAGMADDIGIAADFLAGIG